MLTQMDGNESLKHIERVWHMYNEDNELIAIENIKRLDTHFPNDYYIGPSEVDIFKDEVHRQVSKEKGTNAEIGTQVCAQECLISLRIMHIISGTGT
jgi:hypothetical protein